MARKKHSEATETKAEEQAESPSVQRGERKAGKEKPFANGGLAAGSAALNLKPTPGGQVPSAGGHHMSAGMRSSLSGYPKI